MNNLHPIFEQALAPFLKPVATRNDTPCGCGDEGQMCDRHFAEAMADHAYLRNVPRHQVCGDAQSEQERNQELIDAGRGHLVRP